VHHYANPLRPPYVKHDVRIHLKASSSIHIIMRTSILLPLCTVALAAAANHPDPQVVLQDPQAAVAEPDEYLIELSPGETRWIKEDEKWELRRVRSHTNRIARLLRQLLYTRRHLSLADMMRRRASTSLTSQTLPTWAL
jgi:hypothetical protein